MHLPQLENQALCALSRLGRRPSPIGDLDPAIARKLVNLGLVIRYQTIFLITPLGIVVLQKNPMKRLLSKFAALGDWLGGEARAPQLTGRKFGRPQLVWRA
jgi:hypothetical protein